jgi:hypothetical protein
MAGNTFSFRAITNIRLRSELRLTLISQEHSAQTIPRYR